MKKIFSTLSSAALAIAFALALFVALFVGFANHRSGTVAMSGPVNLSGTWHENPNDNTSASMTADVMDNHIQVFVDSNNTTLLYWDGSFDTSGKNSDSFTVVSQANAGDFLSTASNKIFTYKNGDLSYSFTILGTTRTVHLSRGE